MAQRASRASAAFWNPCGPGRTSSAIVCVRTLLRRVGGRSWESSPLTITADPVNQVRECDEATISC